MLSARGLDVLLTDLEKQQALMAEVADDEARDRAIRRYGQLEERFVALGGYGAESEAGRICASLGLPERVLTQQLRTLSGGQRRRVELARILFAASDSGAGSGTTLLLDEPTNHLDADSIGWLRDFLRAHTGGLVMISHNVDLVADVVNRVWFLDAVRGEMDVYNMGWQKYLDARATDEQRRRRERANAERKAAALRTQAAKLGAKATKAVAAQNMLRRADRMMAALDEERVADKVARIKFPTPAACGRIPLVAKGLSKNYGSLEVFSGVDLAIDRARASSSSDSMAPARPRCCDCWPVSKHPTPGRWSPDMVCASAISRRSTTRWTTTRQSGRTFGTPHRKPVTRSCAACWARSCSAAHSSSNRPAHCPAAKRRASRWPGWWPPRRTCCCSTNRPTTSIPPRANRSLTRCAATAARWCW
ncbi:ABC transporter family protein [Mycobacterium kansasii]|uniref:ABC transporter family protein n=1 Tax=Mycobacterium kansasii TaxID=1768 RepID=A0A1V3XDJ0_MYCKA|nr:ABC transporter family protein [Mycobacterium kansasii]